MSRSPWQSKEWKEKRSLILMNRPNCEWCGKDTKLQIAHKDRSSKWTPNYMKMKDEDILVLCAGCHLGMHKGLDLCPKCHKWKRASFPYCFTCNEKRDTRFGYYVPIP